MAASLTYDFADYGLSDAKPFENASKADIHLAFTTFASEGQWRFDYSEGLSLMWDSKVDATHWAGGFPVEVALSPLEFFDAFQRGVDVALSLGTDPEEYRNLLASWRSSIEACALLLDREMPRNPEMASRARAAFLSPHTK